MNAPYPGAVSVGRKWAYAGLAALVLLNVVLVVLLLRPDQRAASAVAVESAVATPAETAEAVPTEEAPVEEAPPPLQPVPTERLLAAASDLVAWRAVVGACDIPAALEATTDGGVTWTSQDAGVTPIARLKATSSRNVFAIGGGADCAPSFRFSGTAGQTWSTQDGELAGSWYLLPASRAALTAEVHGPRGQVPAPCPTGVVDLAGLDNNRAALLCTDGALQTTDDGGATWSQVGAAPDALAIAPAADGYVVGALRAPCEGVAVLTVANDGTGLDGAAPVCAPGPAPVPGQVALAASGSTLWVWSGDLVARSTDGGVTW